MSVQQVWRDVSRLIVGRETFDRLARLQMECTETSCNMLRHTADSTNGAGLSVDSTCRYRILASAPRLLGVILIGSQKFSQYGEAVAS